MGRYSFIFNILFLLLALLWSPQAQAQGGLMMVSDTTFQRIRIFDPTQETIVYDLTVNAPWAKEGCHGDQLLCFAMGFEYTVHEDRDFLDVALNRLNTQSTGPSDLLPGSLGRVELTSSPTPIFALTALDFRALPLWDDHCPQGADEPYGDWQVPGCGLQFLHSFRIAEEDPAEDWIRYILPDPMNSRILQVYLDYSQGNQVGVVEDVISPATPGWPGEGTPNGLQYITDEPGGPYLLVTYYDTGDRENEGGTLALFRQGEAGWEGAWQWPDPTHPDRPYLHAPHMAQRLFDPVTGVGNIFYAHGRGLTQDWHSNAIQDQGGSLGVLDISAGLSSPPVYLGEADLTTSDGTRLIAYPRDVEVLPDGRLIVMDAVCETVCPEQGRIHTLPPFHRGLTPSPRLGHYSPSHEKQDLIPLSPSDGATTKTCGIGVLFESNYVLMSEVGSHLRRASRRGKRSCKLGENVSKGSLGGGADGR